jgi:hypothetical protein
MRRWRGTSHHQFRLDASRGQAQTEIGFTFGGTMVAPSPEAVSGPSIETLETILDVTYTWGYQDSRAKLRDLYDKATRAQWQGDVVLPWHLSPDLEASMGPEELMPLYGSADLEPPEPARAHRDQRRDHGVDPVAVPPRRAGRAARRRAAGRLGAGSRLEALRRDPGRRRGPPRRRLQPLPAREDRLRLPGEPAPEDAARHDPEGQPLGHEVPRHADHGRGAGAGSVRDDPHAHARSAAARPDRLRDGRRGAPRRVRRPVAARLLPRPARGGAAASARTSSTRPRG